MFAQVYASATGWMKRKCNWKFDDCYAMGSHGIEPKRDWTHFLKIGFVIAGGGFYSYYNLQYIKLYKKKKTVLCIQETFNAVFKMGSISFWVQFHAYLCNGVHNLRQWASSPFTPLKIINFWSDPKSTIKWIILYA